MSHSRHYVTVALPPRDQLCQLCLLVGTDPVNTGIGAADPTANFRLTYMAPNMAEVGHTLYHEISRFTGVSGKNRENPVLHSYAEGAITLKPPLEVCEDFVLQDEVIPPYLRHRYWPERVTAVRGQTCLRPRNGDLTGLNFYPLGGSSRYLKTTNPPRLRRHQTEFPVYSDEAYTILADTWEMQEESDWEAYWYRIVGQQTNSGSYPPTYLYHRGIWAIRNKPSGGISVSGAYPGCVLGSTEIELHMLEGSSTFLTGTGPSSYGSGLTMCWCFPLTPPTYFDVDQVESDVSAQLMSIDRTVYRLIDALPECRSDKAFDLACQATQAIEGIDVNGIDFIRQLKNLRKLLPPLKSLTAYKKPKTWAQLYLWFKYVLQTNMSDVRAIAEGLGAFVGAGGLDAFVKQYNSLKSLYSTSWENTCWEISGHELFITTRANCRVRFSPLLRIESSLEIANALSRFMGLDASLTNLWDLVPFSFVVDWFVKIDELCKRIDVDERWSRLLLQDRLLSYKSWTSVNVVDMETDFFGVLRLSSYVRSVYTDFPTKPYGVSVGTPGGHVMEATALIVAHKGR